MHTIYAASIDNVNNPEATVRSVSFKIDKTKPVITITAPIATTYFLNQVVPASFGCTDVPSPPASGPASSTASPYCIGTVANGVNIDTTLGQHTFTVNATDIADNTETQSVTYNVTYNFTGFFSPVDNLPMVNLAQAGQAIPSEWRIVDANGVGITDPTSFGNPGMIAPYTASPTPGFTSYDIGSCSAPGTPTDAIEEYTTNSNGLLNLGGGNWQFNWNTTKSSAGKCRLAVITLKDGTIHQFKVQFK